MITHKQLSLAEFFEDCQNKFDNNKYQFLSLLDETINLDEIVLVSFVPDASKFTRFKQDFLMDLRSMFDHMVDITEPICQKLDPHLATMTIFDTSGIEARVTENNPKYANRIIKQLKAFAKANNLDKSYDPYKAAYGSSGYRCGKGSSCLSRS